MTIFRIFKLSVSTILKNLLNLNFFAVFFWKKLFNSFDVYLYVRSITKLSHLQYFRHTKKNSFQDDTTLYFMKTEISYLIIMRRKDMKTKNSFSVWNFIKKILVALFYFSYGMKQFAHRNIYSYFIFNIKCLIFNMSWYYYFILITCKILFEIFILIYFNIWFIPILYFIPRISFWHIFIS